ncbi:hypothetical protein C1752_12038 [Acaryochloris thomasi RCC1774]|uniref:DUF7693 domain-containing protein n=1 Tax=Acaryochloris thomasi RCC1774 TaxID=1764569 RepID=A0A2W1JNI8_9CYAN|nr:hypothetical protein [Acaryochloris thomasi]PZD70467.1 hypothetical protein C1752_12038 [Acaryochloris thomasi RCC1774]
MKSILKSLLLTQWQKSQKFSSERPDFNDPTLYSDTDLQHSHCQVGPREVAEVLRKMISGEKNAQAVFDTFFLSCVSGDLFDFTIDDYKISLFIDDPGTFDYIESVTIEGRRAAYGDWKVDPEFLLSEEEQNQFQMLLENL